MQARSKDLYVQCELGPRTSLARFLAGLVSFYHQKESFCLQVPGIEEMENYSENNFFFGFTPLHGCHPPPQRNGNGGSEVPWPFGQTSVVVVFFGFFFFEEAELMNCTLTSRLA